MHAARTAMGAWRRWCVAGLAFASVLAAPPAWALKFRSINDNSVLLVYDCGKPGFQDEPREGCLPHEKSFSGPRRYPNGAVYPGDGAELERLLGRGHAYSQVWLFSGGGNLAEGIKVGETLRRYNQYVVVPAGAECVSACTMAFLGGRIREVDPAASYEVHAYSGLLHDTAEDMTPYLGPDGEFALDEFVRREATGAREWAARLFRYAQRMIGGAVDERGMSAVLAGAPDFAARYRASGQARTDLERMRREGATSAQEVLMRIERDAFNLHLAHLKASTAQLGPRAGSAADILDIMFASRIAGTYKLDQNTLKEKGYTNVRR